MNISNRIAQKHVFRYVSVLIFVWISVYAAGCGSGKHFQQGARQSANESPSQRAAISYIPTPNISVDSSITENAEIANFLKPYSDSLNHTLSTTLAKIDSPFYNTFYTGNLGRLVADYMLLTATQYSMEHVGIPCHFAVANNGGLRAGLFPGPVMMRHVFEVTPFDNELVILQLSGGATDSLLRYIAQLTGTPVSGLLLEYEKADKPAKNRVVNAKINSKIISTPADLGYLHGSQEQYSGSGMPTDNQSSDGMNQGNNKISMSGSQLPFDSRRDYLVATSSYMSMGGDGFTMLKGAKQTI